jgi:hypothetical protein
MSKSQQALLLVGSPRGGKSNSAMLGRYLLEKLDGSFASEEIQVQASLSSEDGKTKMLTKAGESDLLILAFPLYVDCLPAPVISALELLAANRRNAASPKKQRLVAIVNSGFPEASQNHTALAICRRFAFEAGIEWAGGLGLGGGGAITGEKLEDAGFVAGNARKALDLAANNLRQGNPVSNEAANLMAKTAIPKWLYLYVGNRGWKKQAKANGVQDQLYRQT